MFVIFRLMVNNLKPPPSLVTGGGGISLCEMTEGGRHFHYHKPILYTVGADPCVRP